MQSNYFYCDEAVENNSAAKGLIEQFRDYAEREETRVYLLSAPLEYRDSYRDSDCLVIAVPNRKVAFASVSSSSDTTTFQEDFREDVGTLSAKYGYRKKLGRPREWCAPLFVDLGFAYDAGFMDRYSGDTELHDANDRRKTWFLVSLLIGSINNIEDLDVNATNNLLDNVKQKIVLFDGQQSRFIYESMEKKRVVIQGMAGTGKTELLLHKLRELYTFHPNGENFTIFFTCYNRVLANKMKVRVTAFFNYMKVDEQIEWGTRLHVARSWGSKSDRESGLYSYICNMYGIQFRSYREASFDRACRLALEEIPSDALPCLDYILIDESQDFPDSFFGLCERVARRKIYVAGDVFQDIYEEGGDVRPDVDYLLNSCYRTDPRTLLFAHALGLGLCERPVIRWLDNDMWSDCGYVLTDINDGEVSIERRPINRFGLVGGDGVPEAISVRATTDFVESIYSIILEIKQTYHTVKPGDIAIVFPGNGSRNYEIADQAASLIKRRLGWNVIRGYDTKFTDEDHVFISNRNNIKGLEFPFVICFAIGEIGRNLTLRNALYMILTRSFLTSYLIVNEGLPGPISAYEQLANRLRDHRDIVVRKPSVAEIAEQNRLVTMTLAENRAKSLETIIRECLDDAGYSGSDAEEAESRLAGFFSANSLNEDNGNLRERVEAAIKIL